MATISLINDMAQIVVITKDKVDPADPVNNAGQYKRGDVICALPDDWVFGDQELSNPMFQIIKIPDMSVTEANALCAEELGDRKVNPYLWRRLFKIDVDSSASLKTAVGDGSKRQSASIIATKTDIASLKIQKPSQENQFIP